MTDKPVKTNVLNSPVELNIPSPIEMTTTTPQQQKELGLEVPTKTQRLHSFNEAASTVRLMALMSLGMLALQFTKLKTAFVIVPVVFSIFTSVNMMGIVLSLMFLMRVIGVLATNPNPSIYDPFLRTVFAGILLMTLLSLVIFPSLCFTTL
jgi:hypothetical protein